MKEDFKCFKNGILRKGESCRFNNNCIYPYCNPNLDIWDDLESEICTYNEEAITIPKHIRENFNLTKKQ